MTEPTDDAPTEPAAPAPTPAAPGGNPLLLRGFAPLALALLFAVVGLVAVLVILLAPSVAPEVEILRPGAPVTTTTESTRSTTTTETTGATTTTESSGSTTGPSSTAPSSTGPAEETAP